MPDPAISLQLECAINDDAWIDYFKEDHFVTIMTKTILNDDTDRQLLQDNNDLHISLLLTNSEEIKALNRDYRDKDKPTNVLSFPMLEHSDPTDPKSPFIMGDIALCFEIIEQEADEQGKEIQDHITHMLVHAVLHLLGYDHENNDEAEEMEALEIKILKDFDISNPYDRMT